MTLLSSVGCATFNLAVVGLVVFVALIVGFCFGRASRGGPLQGWHRE